jgi:transposase
VAYAVTAGQRHDVLPAPALIAAANPRRLLGDKGYDSAAIRANLAARGCEAVIPPQRDRTVRPAYDRALYKARAEVECTINLLKQARRLATRYEKTLRNYTAVVAIGCALLWLRI